MAIKLNPFVLQATSLSIAFVCLSISLASAQNYPISGVWVATEGRTPGSQAGACFALKVLGVGSIQSQSLPTVLIFSDGKRFEIRSGSHSEQFARSVRKTADGSFRIYEVPRERTRWIPWSKSRSYSLTIVDPVTIQFEDGKTNTRFVKCSKNSLL
jgi:hypothetical protein